MRKAASKIEAFKNIASVHVYYQSCWKPSSWLRMASRPIISHFLGPPNATIDDSNLHKIVKCCCSSGYEMRGFLGDSQNFFLIDTWPLQSMEFWKWGLQILPFLKRALVLARPLDGVLSCHGSWRLPKNSKTNISFENRDNFEIVSGEKLSLLQYWLILSLLFYLTSHLIRRGMRAASKFEKNEWCKKFFFENASSGSSFTVYTCAIHRAPRTWEKGNNISM